jgi:hypothetical protein
MIDNITLRRADAKMLRNVLRDLAGEYSSDTGLISPEERAALAALEAALAEPSLKVRVDSTAFTASAFSQTAVLEQAEAFETAYQTKRAALDPAFAELPAKPEPATDAEMLKAYRESAADGWQFCDGWRDAERFHGIGKGGKT